ncbi:ACT domain-containing protein [uncultured Pseudoramibacter sp.]|jgi:ACT domain-containing protein|uniref:ACT domain-containing protein n=1 Tax=uncultured Pseudoramibacter sp. TaxID=1623493 RepID=UPI0025D86823|nr:ACT domain-containing protein [uncultured Pseudoramibacter sp.]
MRAVITVIGKDKIGIIYRVSEILSKYKINIEDISQTILQDVFTMVMLVDLSESTCKFTDLKNKLEDLGKEIGMTIRIQNEDIFNAMHTI